MWDWVGGPLSVWSAVGLAAALAMGFEKFAEFLAGGREMDVHFSTENLEKNIPVLLALIGVWNTNFLDAATHAVLPTRTRCASCPPTCSSSRWSRTASASTARARAVDYATAPGALGIGGNGEPAFVPPTPAPGHAGGAVDFIDASRMKFFRQCASPGRSPRLGTTDPPSRPTGNTRATVPPRFFLLKK